MTIHPQLAPLPHFLLHKSEQLGVLREKMQPNDYFYLASCYSRYPAGLQAAFKEVSRMAAKFILAGVPVFSPIAHSHPISICGAIDSKNHDIWLPADRPLFNQSCGIIVAEMDGWEKSYGIGEEIQWAKAQGKPIYLATRGLLND